MLPSLIFEVAAIATETIKFLFDFLFQQRTWSFSQHIQLSWSQRLMAIGGTAVEIGLSILLCQWQLVFQVFPQPWF